MGMNFPATPLVGEVYNNYTWDGEKWAVSTDGGGGGGGASVLVGSVPPVGAPDNSLWMEDDTGILYILYNDGTSSQWVAVTSSVGTGMVRYDAAQGLSVAQQLQARTNIAAAPFDALAYNGLQINGGMEVSQFFGTTATSAPNGTWTYAIDGWTIVALGTGTFAFNQSGATPVRGFRNAFRMYCGTPYTLAAANDLLGVAQNIEGSRWARLGFGGAGALPVTIGFWVAATVAGTMTVAVRNNTRAYLAPVAITTGGPWEYKTVTIPGDVTGTWGTDNTLGGQIFFGLGANTGYSAQPNVWLASNSAYCHTGVTNFFATANNEVYITGVTVLPGTVAPTAAQSPLFVRPYDQEWLTCKRYWQKLSGIIIETGSLSQSVFLPVAMRAPPTITGGGAGFAVSVNTGITAHVYQTTRNYQDITFDARL